MQEDADRGEGRWWRVIGGRPRAHDVCTTEEYRGILCQNSYRVPRALRQQVLYRAVMSVRNANDTSSTGWAFCILILSIIMNINAVKRNAIQMEHDRIWNDWHYMHEEQPTRL